MTAGLLAAGLLAVGPARAEVTRFELQGAAAPAFGGREFGPAGRYERIVAKATIALDPADARNAIIADLALAPRNAAGKVEAVAEVVILRPAEAARGNGTLLLEVPNRGREIIGQLMNDAPAANLLSGGTDPGNGHLMRQGYTLAWIGWWISRRGRGCGWRRRWVPNVTGPSREEFLFDHTRSPVTVPLTYPAAATEGATLTVRAQAGDARQTPPACPSASSTRSASRSPAPPASMPGRSTNSSTRRRTRWCRAWPSPPSATSAPSCAGRRGRPTRSAAGQRGTVDQAVLTGVSQSGRFVRDYLYLGFNEDERGRQVYGAMLAHIPGTRRSFTNARFAQPGRNPTPHGDRHYPADQFPFTYATVEDHLTGKRDGLLQRCRATNTCPRIMQTDSEYEFWGAHASLLVTDTRGNHLDLPPEVRAYMMTGHPHYAAAQAVAERIDRCALPVNPLQAGAPMRALLAAMEAWQREGVEPPASRYPMRSAGTLLPAVGLYPAIPALGYRRDLRPSPAGGQLGGPAGGEGRIHGAAAAGRCRRQCDRRRPQPGDRGAEGEHFRLEPARRRLRRGRALLQYRRGGALRGNEGRAAGGQ